MDLYSLVYKSSLITGSVFLCACAIVGFRYTWVHKEQNIKNQRFHILNCKFKLCLNWEVVGLMMVRLSFYARGLFGVWDEFLYWGFWV